MITPLELAINDLKNWPRTWPDGTERYSPILEYLLVVLRKVRLRHGGFDTFRTLCERYAKALSVEELDVLADHVRLHDPLFYNKNFRKYKP